MYHVCGVTTAGRIAVADRYCGNCGHELRTDDRVCPNCWRAIHETAVVPTPGDLLGLLARLLHLVAGSECWRAHLVAIRGIREGSEIVGGDEAVLVLGKNKVRASPTWSRQRCTPRPTARRRSGELRRRSGCWLTRRKRRRRESCWPDGDAIRAPAFHKRCSVATRSRTDRAESPYASWPWYSVGCMLSPAHEVNLDYLNPHRSVPGYNPGGSHTSDRSECGNDASSRCHL